MTQMTVGEFKAKFSEVLKLVTKGEEVEILYGRAKEPIARLVSPHVKQRGGLLGALEGKASFTMSDDWKVTPEELLGL